MIEARIKELEAEVKQYESGAGVCYLAARIELLEAENAKLREELARTKEQEKVPLREVLDTFRADGQNWVTF